jgi:transposase
MEDLTNCRERTFEKRRKGKNASEKQRVANRDHSSWSYAELANFVEYKAFFFDSMLLKVDPRNTSRKCSKCGFTSEENRPNGSLLFTCKACSRKVHSDKNGADNIKQKTLDIRQDLIFTGCLSITPKVSGNDGSLIRSHETNSQP